MHRELAVRQSAQRIRYAHRNLKSNHTHSSVNSIQKLAKRKKMPNIHFSTTVEVIVLENKTLYRSPVHSAFYLILAQPQDDSTSVFFGVGFPLFRLNCARFTNDASIHVFIGKLNVLII